MRKPLFLLVLTALAVSACAPKQAANPDPNHTHADFADFVNGEQLDFSASELMSGISTDATTHDEEAESRHDYYHLHDSNGNVIHRHKPGLPLQEFFDSLQVGFDALCYASFAPMADGQICGETPFRMFVNGKEQTFDLDYVFTDLDQILLTNASTDADVAAQLQKVSDDACLYSQTCPSRGKPPAENCIADPAVPCVE